MDSVQETPLKRRKTEKGHLSTRREYDSGDDSGDNIFDEIVDETVPTVPVLSRKTNAEVGSSLRSYPIFNETQPTQLLGEPIPHSSSPPPPKGPSVQVVASSPARPISMSPTREARVKSFARSIAPPGTVFRMPPGATKPAQPKEVIELSDDDRVPYGGGSSDDDTQRRSRDIKPSMVQDRQSYGLPVRASPKAATSNPKQKFNQIIAGSLYNGGNENSLAKSAFQGSLFDPRNRDDKQTTSHIEAPKRYTGSLAGAYGDSPIKKRPKIQTGPSRAAPVKPTLEKLEDIPDWTMRNKVKRIMEILTEQTVNSVYNALADHHGDEQDTMDYLVTMEDYPREAELPKTSFYDLTQDDNEEDELSQLPIPKKPAAKQQLKAPAKSLHQKYSSTQHPAATQRPQASSISEKPKRKLVRGRKHQSSPQNGSSSPVAPPIRQASPDSEDEDSGIASSETDGADFNGSLLNFFNTCSVPDLVDIASTTEELANLIISKKPFKNLDQVRKVKDDSDEQKPQGKRKRGTQKNIGEKILDVCERMWQGYSAIDELVRHCEDISKPVATEMKKWGVNVYGGSSAGELEIVSLGSDGASDRNPPDSGIGTPKSNSSVEEDVDGQIKSTKRNKLLPQPAIMPKEVTLKDYQVVGMNWLSLLYNNGLSCILADDMGLGKTCQVIAFLAHLFEQKQEEGPHLIVVPSSVIENWIREFQTFCPALSVFPYHGSQAERFDFQMDIQENMPNVVITTYTIAKKKADMKFLRHLRPTVCVYDEGHALKNQDSNAYEQLMKIKCEFRLLLTGTPLQNNLGELASLLRFILPKVFQDHEEDLRAIFAHKATTENHTHGALLSDQRVAKAKSILTPFILRRKKNQVLKYLPKKTRRVEWCEMTEWQKHVYDTEWERSQKSLQGRARGDKDAEKNYNIQMALRKAAMHPLLHRYKYDDAKIKEMGDVYMRDDPTFNGEDQNAALVYEDLMVLSDFGLLRMCDTYESLGQFKLPEEPWMDCGKVERLVSLLLEYRTNGDRVLIFSQMTSVLDILEEVLNTINIKFCRLDGTTPVAQRQELIDLFYSDDSITAFMVSTKAGGAGINLAAANKVIIFDSGYNPQDDIQAENRAHRVGQTREVEVVRLVTKGTIEEAIHALGETKLALDEKVAASEGDKTAEKKVEATGVKEVLKYMEQMQEKAEAQVQ